MEDIYELVKHDKIVSICMSEHQLGHLTEKEALMQMVILLASHSYNLNKEFVDAMMNRKP